MRDKLRKGLWFIGNGKVPPIWRMLSPNRDPEETKINYLETVDSSVRPPLYIDSDVEISYKESMSSGKSYKRFFSTVIGETNRLSLEIDPEFPIDGCFFHLLNPNNFGQINVSMTGQIQESERKIEQEYSFKPGTQMNIGSLPVSSSFNKPLDGLTIDVVGKGLKDGGFKGGETNLSISAPSIRKTNQKETPIFLISIDTFRYDHLGVFDDLKSMLDNVIIPNEPRTQGRYTRPSHASTLTGTHPGTHGYCTGFGRQVKEGIPITSISPDLKTLPETLTENGYTCGASTAWGSITPKFGFGRGFQEFRLEKRDWNKYRRDSDTIVNRALEWTEQMLDSQQQDIFYFMHIFDAHLPYLAFKTLRENKEIRVDITDRFKEEYINPQPLDYDDLMQYATDIEAPDFIEEIKQYYQLSLKKVSKSLTRFIHTLDHLGIRDESLIIIAGDHGEEFLEQGIAGHATLRNENIRPGMLVKPPKGSDFFVPDEADLIDIFPTLSDFVANEIPDQCDGRSWLRIDSTDGTSKTRITEAFTGTSTYAISVEVDGSKGIFAYEADIPSRPDSSQIDSGPKYMNYTNTSNTKRGGKNDEEIPKNLQTQMENIAANFIRSRVGKCNQGEEIQLTKGALNRLEELGYK